MNFDVQAIAKCNKKTLLQVDEMWTKESNNNQRKEKNLHS